MTIAPERSEATQADERQPTQWFESDPLWFKRAVFYEIHIRGFFDSNDDGSGDLRGIQDKLDYLQWLGVDCIWLLPMYASPLRDGGYDIADFYAIHPDYGTVDDFRNLVEAAHERGIRIIADLVVNHTSSDHPWFQESRSSPDSPKRDWYVWSDTDDRYPDARIIFVDTEPSNWTWDPVAGAYYWHRFFSHQPDLNYDNPEVQEAHARRPALLARRRHRRLPPRCRPLPLRARRHERREPPRDARVPASACAPRSTRSTRTACCSPRRTSGRRTSSRTSARATSATWPSTSRSCRACSWRCAARTRRPSTRSSTARPPIPDNAQWGLFLRNHDELTLEMVTDEERDYMYAEYAKDPRMKLNLGIRRRLAPLLDNGRDESQLLHAIMFSLPGSPVLYYGDEIGMGDNVFLGDRDGVRTPMQWTGDRNGGFSRADFAQLYLPPLMDPVWGYQACNVEAQLRTPTSFLRWLHRFISLRKAHPVFGLGSYEPLRDEQPAHLRPRPPVRGGRRALRPQPRPLGPAGGAGPAPVRG